MPEIRLHSKPGFTILEVVLALALIGFIMLPVMWVQLSTTNRVRDAIGRVQRMMLMQDFLFSAREEARKKQETAEFMLDKRIIDPPTILSYRREPIGDRFGLGPLITVAREQVTATWQDRQEEKKLSVVTMLCNPRFVQQGS